MHFHCLIQARKRLEEDLKNKIKKFMASYFTVLLGHSSLRNIVMTSS